MARIKEEDLRLNLIINGDETRKKMGELREEINKVKTSTATLEKERKKLVKQFGEESIQVKNLDKQLETHRNGLKNLRNAYNDYERRLSITGMTMKELSSHARNVSAILRNLKPGTADFEKYNQELKKTRDRMRDLKGQSDSTGKAMQSMAAGLKTAYMGVVGAVYGLARVFGGAINTMKDFEQANVNLSTILGVTTDQMGDLTEEALRLGRSTRYTASEVTALQTELAKLGFNQGQIKAMEEPVLNFATAVGAELPEAAALAGAALRMFGLNSTDAEDTLAALALSTNKSALSFGYLQNSLSTVGPVAKTFGFGIKDTTALLGALANSGFDASSAATATRNIILKLADANGDLAKALGGPVKTFDELIAGLQSLNEKGVDLTTTLELTDKRSVAAFNSFLSGADSAMELRDALLETDGALKDIAEQRMNTLEGATLTLKSAWQGFVLELRGSTGVLKSITDGLTLIVQGMTDVVSGGKIRHENSVNALLEDLRFSFETEEEAAEEAARQMEKYQKQAVSLREQIENEADKKRKKRLEKELKEAEEYVSRYKDAIGRLNTSTDESSGATTSGTGSSGGSAGGSGGGKKNKKAWSLQSDEVYLKDKATLTEKYNNGELESKAKYEDELFELEKEAYNRRLRQHKESGAARRKIESDLQTTILKHTEAVQKRNKETEEQKKKELDELKKTEAAYLAAYTAGTASHEDQLKLREKQENEQYEREKALLDEKEETDKNFKLKKETLELQHQNNLRKIRLDAYEAEKKDLDLKHKEELANIKKRYAAAQILNTNSSAAKLKAKRDEARDTAGENLAYLQTQVSLLEKIVSSGQIGEGDKAQKISDDQLKQYKTQLAELMAQLDLAKAEVENLKGNFWKSVKAGAGGGSFLGVSQSDWDTLFDNLHDGTLSVKDLQTALSGIGGAAKDAFSLASKYIAMTDAQEKKEFDDWTKEQDEKKAKLQKRLDDGLMTQSQFNAEVEQMEKDKQAKEDQMKLDQAQKQKTLSIVQAIINTALGVTQTLAQWGLPFGLVPAAAMAAMGAAEIAMISSTPVGYAKGGPVKVKRSQDGKEYNAVVDPDKRGYVDRPTILVGEEGGEYVIPADGVKNPSIAPVLAQIENARRMGTLKNLSLQATYPAASGYATGGFTSRQAASSAGEIHDTNSANTAVLSALESVAARLQALTEKPIQAIVSMLGKNGLQETMDKRANQVRRGQL
ncbi:MAG: phage tail tape measure protein [Prevotella sp.]|nr:phage tail tape measure protein [Prevotella sp.]